ncbi:TPA: DUF3908 family protein [Bacillus cereus]
MNEETIIRELYEFERVKEILKTINVSSRKLIRYAELLVPIAEDTAVYCKNLYNNGVGAYKELYFFTNEKIYLIKEINSGIKYQILYKKDINSIEYEISDNDEKFVALKIKFVNDEIIEMGSLEDRGSASVEAYRNVIQYILKTLT